VAQNRYAKLLAVGEGVDADLEAAAMWRSLSRRQGLSDPSLDRLLVSVPAETLTRAEERARFWPSEPPTTETAETILEIPTTTAPAIEQPLLPAPTDPSEAPATKPPNTPPPLENP
jgi:hypothetical protein